MNTVSPTSRAEWPVCGRFYSYTAASIQRGLIQSQLWVLTTMPSNSVIQRAHFSIQLFSEGTRPLEDTTVGITGLIQIYCAIANEILAIKEPFHGAPRQCYAAARFLPVVKPRGI